MSSSPIDADRLPTIGAESEAELRFEIEPHGLIKRILPRTLFGRSLLIVLIPMILVQAIAAWIFYDRHWAAVSWRLCGGVVGDVALLIDATTLARTEPETRRLLRRAGRLTDLHFTLERGAKLPARTTPATGSLTEDQLDQWMQNRIDYPYQIDMAGNPGAVRILVQMPQGVLHVRVPDKRLYSYTTYIFIMWMVGSAVVLLGVAILFLRNQVKSVRRLAAAADGFGKGLPVPFSKPEGALEIRQAAVAFIKMRDRIQRQIRQRTQMLAGVSHDLRTPLTRMKLALELLGGDPAVHELKSDVAEMEHMVNGYLDFVRGEGDEAPVETDIALLLEDVAATMRREGTPLSLATPPEYVLPVRPNALKRCLGNLIGNASRHGSHVWLIGVVAEDGLDIIVDDDGPGIPPADRVRAFRPFVRLDPSRSPATGGVGLGLTIARDVARSHGGDLQLEESPQGGLRARLHLPR